MIRVKGYELADLNTKDISQRRAVQFKNSILHALKTIGVPEHQVEIKLESIVGKKAPASALWFSNGRRMFYKYDSCGKFIENLYVVSKVIELEVEALLDGKKEEIDFISEFTEDEDVEEQRKQAREVLGVHPDSKDLDEINKKYKDLARAHHPDTPNGDLEKFKAINHAHKTLKRELA